MKIVARGEFVFRPSTQAYLRDQKITAAVTHDILHLAITGLEPVTQTGWPPQGRSWREWKMQRCLHFCRCVIMVVPLSGCPLDG